MQFTNLSTLVPLFLASLVASHSITASAPVIQWVSCSENVPDSTGTFNATAIDLTTLPSNLQCGRLDVPMDYSKPICDTNRITLGVAVVRSSSFKGPLFL